MTLTSSSSSARRRNAAREHWGPRSRPWEDQAASSRLWLGVDEAESAGEAGGRGAEGAASGRSRGGAGEGARGFAAAGPSR